MSDLYAKLAAPFPADKVSWRVGSVKKDGTAAMALAYIDARDVMDRLDDACGPGAWQNRYTHADKKTVCEIAILIDGEWVWKADGAGESDIEAEKGALSDAFKRAAVRWGIGRYLYHLPSPWVRIDQYKKILPEETTKLEALLRRVSPPSPVKALPQPEEPPPGEPDGPGARKSAAQAKRDGDNEKMKAEIAKLDCDGLRDFHENFDSYTAHLPRGWLDPVRDMLENRLLELNGADSVREAAEELDAGFRGTLAGGTAGGVSRRNGELAA